MTINFAHPVTERLALLHSVPWVLGSSPGYEGGNPEYDWVFVVVW